MINPRTILDKLLETKDNLSYLEIRCNLVHDNIRVAIYNLVRGAGLQFDLAEAIRVTSEECAKEDE